MKNTLLTLLFFASLSACQETDYRVEKDLYLGADLSYVNEVEDCGAKFKVNSRSLDPYQLFADRKANIVRLRLWHNPQWTSYSTLEDIKKSISRAKAKGMNVLLDFHYSDNWADPAHQIIPEAWRGIKDVETLGDSVYTYTYSVLNELYKEHLLPEMVQIGNEINSEILMEKPTAENPKTNWNRNTSLLNKGIKAVNDFNVEHKTEVKTMLHVAQPENAIDWFKEANSHSIANYDWIGLSYYPNWSTHNLTQLGEVITQLKNTYNKEVMIVEVGYPYTHQNVDEANNVLGLDSGLKGYPVSPIGQLSFMIDLTSEVVKAGGKGVIYWEAAWVSSSCETLWGKGSHWENATFFDATQNNEALPVFDYLKHNYQLTNALTQN